ncbi:MAG: hypothetical protein BGO01_14735 [Armatimonadetes bacterium 55-13]|nr:MAG: hypothetical protein BGO01_14735 [Armatimonadetes bacterium 55-13]
MKRIIFTVATGHDRYAEMAMGLARSLQMIGDTTPRVVVTDNHGYDWSRYYSQVLAPSSNDVGVFFEKYTALERTDADQVIFIDSDCLAFKRLDAVFDRCAGAAVAVQGRWETNGVWYEKGIEELLHEFNIQRIPRLNSGVVYYERSAQFSEVLEKTRELALEYPKLGMEVFRGKVPDEPCLALGLSITGHGEVLPLEMNLNESGVGLMGKLNLDVLTGTCKFVTGNPNVRLVEPFIFHAHYFSKLRVYWKELEKLKKLEVLRDRNGPRYMSRWLRLRRSVERRLLRLSGKL